MTQPLKKFKSGSIEAAVWSNERDVKDSNTKVEFKTVSLRKSWKDDKDVWRDATINLRRSDLIKAILVLEKAQEELFLGDG
jgi:hypothetical protein